MQGQPVFRPDLQEWIYPLVGQQWLYCEAPRKERSGSPFAGY